MTPSLFLLKTITPHLLQLLAREKEVRATSADRKQFAAKAFMTSSHYDTHIFNYFNREFNFEVFKKSELQSKVLRYGENPHQKGVFYGKLDELFDMSERQRVVLQQPRRRGCVCQSCSRI
jgi:AICAR transformylase/IMP cyclohydrolase PurH